MRVGHVPRGRTVRTALVFGHRAAAIPPLARDAYDGIKDLREAVAECVSASVDRHGARFETALFSGCTSERAHEDPVLADALAFTHQYAAAKLLLAWGLEPVAVMGAGVGDYVAACVAGVLSSRDALRLIGAGPSRAAAFRFVACSADEDALERLLAGHGGQVLARSGGELLVSAAAHPAALMHELRSKGIAVSALRDARDAAGGALDTPLECRAPRIAIVSAHTGLRLGDEARDPRFWMGRTCWPGAIERAFDTLFELGCDAIVESPGLMLSRVGRERNAASDVSWLQVRACAPSLRACWARLFTIGAVSDLRAFQGGRGRRVALPTYPFERRKLWMQAASGPEAEPQGLGPGLDVPEVGTVYPAVLDARRLSYLDGHRVHDRIVVPATAFVDLALAAAARLPAGQGRQDSRVLRDVVLHAPLVLEDGPREMRVVVSDEAQDGSRTIKIHAAAAPLGGGWRCHLTARLAREAVRELAPWHRTSAEARCSTPLDADAFYARFAERGLSYAREFRSVRALQAGSDEALGWIEPAPGTAYAPAAASLDAALQVAAGAGALRADPVTRVPFAIDRIAQHRPCPDRFWSHARVEHTAHDDQASFTTHVRIYDQAERLCVEIDGVVLRAIAPAALAPVATARPSVDALEHGVRWRVAPPPPRLRSIRGERWLVLCDGHGIGDAFIERLRHGGAARTITAQLGSTTRKLGPERWQIEAGSPAAITRAIDDVLAAQGDASFDHAVYLWALDERACGDALMAGQLRVCGGALLLLQALSRRSHACAVWLVTCGATHAGDDAPAPGQAPLWGLGRTALRELPRLAISLVDLEPGREAAWQADRLWGEVRLPVIAREVAHRGASRQVPELVRTGDRAEPRLAAPLADNHTVVVGHGSLESLQVLGSARRTPTAHEVEIAVEAAGLNFRDVLVALGSYPGDAPPLGGECFGRIASVGSAVRDFAVGQPVVAIASGALSRFVCVDERRVAPSPARLRSEQAAGIPVAYTTASYALDELAKLRGGERVLIHAAAGGVGLAAVQLAQRRGADVIATAAPWKWQALRTLGVAHVLSSRTLAFADPIASPIVAGGVDVVLNSLTGPAIEASLSLLRPGGRFIELGKREIWSVDRVRARQPTVEYRVLDLAEIDEGHLGRILREICEAIETQKLAPLPVRTFPLDEAIAGFRHMARAQHIGKIVFEIRDRGAAMPTGVRRDATYLVTGGLGGIGLEVGRWLVEAGAGEVVLVGRRAPRTPAWPALEAEGRQRGTVLRALSVDVTDVEALRHALGEIGSRERPLRGVIHAAGVLDDGVLEHLDWPRFWTVLSPKLEGAWHLHTLTMDRRLDFFCLFSSAASLLGAPGQASYAAANAFLDALAHHRRALGLPATVINWGAWAEVGMARSLDPATLARWRQRGVGMLAPEDARRWLGRAAGAGETQIAVLPIQWELFLRQFPAGGVPPLLQAMSSVAGGPGVAAQPAVTESLAGLGPEGRHRAISSIVLRCAKQVLGSGEASSIDAKQPLRDLGLDSLMAIELRNLLGRELGLELPTSFAFDHPTVAAQARALGAQLAGNTAPAAPAAPGDGASIARPAEHDRAAALDDLSDDELLALARTEVAALERGPL
ncbi:MAG TPA: SDR family NAD(P)-dependent oxidoreductase [Kofleriaceae bacterium]|nr:SDR family NAD(P)-dependent oxidoreductase [Kofleriaceae bacterium]